MNTSYFSQTLSIAISATVVTIALLASPALAANYAYVDTTGEVRSFAADTWQQAIVQAPNIHMHSGVMLMNSQSDYRIVGTQTTRY